MAPFYWGVIIYIKVLISFVIFLKIMLDFITVIKYNSKVA